jgi:hypothetical protein
MKYTYIILLTTTLALLQLSGTDLPIAEIQVPRVGGRIVEYRMSISTAKLSPPTTEGADVARDTAEADKLYGLHYDGEENSWTLYATVLQLKSTSVYGRPGEIAQIEYSLAGGTLRNGWIVLRIDDYSFVEETSDDDVISIGQNLRLYITGEYVLSTAVNWEMCPKDDTYCTYASFVEGGFPESEDYDGLTLCPSNTLLRSGYISDDWINGMLAWRVRT